MKRKAILVVTLYIVLLHANGQRKDFSISIPSPTVASLGSYVEMPVSYFTGIPDISIPIYDLKSNKLSLPVSLSYHAGGLRPDNHPGWVGNGWSLIAGGYISRKANGNIDEYNKPAIGKVGYYFNYSNLNSSDWSSTNKLENLGVSYFNVDGIPQPQYIDSDTEPDEFTFNFPGYSGKFYLDQNGVWQVQCDKPLKVEFNSNDFVDPFTRNLNAPNLNINTSNISKTFGRFTIIDELGNKYIFGSIDANNTAIEFSDVMVPQSGNRGASITATSWFLTKMISADATDSLILNYERGPFTSYIGYAQASTAIDASGGGFFSLDPPCQYASNGVPGLNGTVIFPVYLTSILSPSRNIKIDFTNKSKSNELVYKWDGSNVNAYANVYTSSNISLVPLPNDFPSFYLEIVDDNIIPYFGTNIPSNLLWERFLWLKLDGVKVMNTSNNALIKEVNFSYSNNINKRLQLNKVDIKDKQSVLIGSYSLSYNSTPLPDYLTIYGDHWGFNNYSNIVGNNNLLPGRGGISSNDYLSLRSPDPTGVQTQAEILKTITYPTGGSTTYIYEPNRYSSMIDRTSGTGKERIFQNGTAGGLRVKQINNTDNLGNTYTKNYYYVNNYNAGADPSTLTSSGVLDSKPQYTFNTSGKDNSGYMVYYQTISSHPVIPLSTNSSGTHIGYTNVVESRSDGSYTLFKFSNQDNTLFQDQPSINDFNKWALAYSPLFSQAYKRGKLLERIDKDNNGNTVAEETTQYDNVGPIYVVNSVYIYRLYICNYRQVITRVAYQNSLQSFMPVSTTKKIYPLGIAGNPLEKTTSQLYDTNRNIVLQQYSDSKGVINKVYFRYPYNFTNDQPDNSYKRMVEMNNIGKIVEKIETTNNDIGIRSMEFNTFRMYDQNKVYQDEFYKLENDSIELFSKTKITTLGPTGKIEMDPKYKLRFKLSYDNAGNVSTVDKISDAPIAYLWNYNRQFPVAKVVNASNIYESGISNNVEQQASFSVNINGNPPFVENNFDLRVTQNGSVFGSFAYSNPFVDGNNSTTIAVSLIGVSNQTYYNYTTACSKTNGNTSGCNNNTWLFSNVPSGNYRLRVTIISVSGFTNYYGYKLNVNYPSLKYAVVPAYSSLAYTSFETTDHGYWANVNDAYIQTGSSLTGNKFYVLAQAITRNDLSYSNSYIVSYWKNGSACSVSGSQIVKTGRTINGWTYYEHLVSGVSSVTVSGGGNIDELRLYPSNAQMTTYTYNPIYGMTSECSINSNIIYYEYDSFGRLYIIRDQDGKVVKKICYNYAGIAENCN